MGEPTFETTFDVLVNPTNDPLMLVSHELESLVIHYEAVPAFLIAKTKFGVCKMRRRNP